MINLKCHKRRLRKYAFVIGAKSGRTKLPDQVNVDHIIFTINNIGICRNLRFFQ